MKKFIEFSKEIGENPAYIQGRGGNTSYKKRRSIFIKASGIKLKEIEEKNALVGCDLIMLQSYLSHKKNKKNDEELNKLVDISIISHNKSVKPSIEIGMHVVLPSRYVIHTHSVYVNVFACMNFPENFLNKLLVNYPFMIIPYKNPGYELAAYLLKLQKNISLPPILILKNHGLLIHSDSLSDLKKMHTYVNKTLQKITGKYQHFKPAKQKNIPLVIPDAVIYNSVQQQNNTSETKGETDEILSSLSFVVNSIRKMNRTVAYLSAKNIQYILAMEREKLRIKAIHQK